MPLRQGRFIVLGLAIVLIALGWRTVFVEREKRRITAAYEEAKQTLSQLEEERAHLTTELTQARGTIDDQTGNLTTLQQELQGVQSRLDQTVAELTSLQREHEQLRQQNTSLGAQLDSVTAEKQQLAAKLSSIKELKVAIHDIKRKMWNERLAAWRARVEALKQADQERLASGNRGFVVREGAPTLGTAVKLHVRVLEPESK